MPGIGDRVVLRWLDLSHGGVSIERGTLGVVVNAQDKITELVIETDGGATFIARSLVVSVEKE